MCVYKVKSLSRVRLFATLFPSPRDLPDPGIEPGSPSLQADSSLSEPPGKPCVCVCVCVTEGFPGCTHGKEPACQCRRHKRQGSDPWVRKIPWRRAWQPTPVFLPGESHGRRSLADYSPWGRKESDMTETT